MVARATRAWTVFRRRAADILWQNAQVPRQAIFGAPDSDKYLPLNLLEDAHTMFAGYVGQRFQPGGTLLVAINPGGGGDTYAIRTQADEVIYPALVAFKGSDATNRINAFEDVNETFAITLPAWNVSRIIAPTLAAAQVQLADICYLNFLPYRTRNNRLASVEVLSAAWQKVMGPALAILRPGTLIALGMKAGGALDRFYMNGADTFCIPRTNGDRYLSDRARATLAELRRHSIHKSKSGQIANDQ